MRPSARGTSMRTPRTWELQKDILHIDGVTGTGSLAAGRPRHRYRVPGWGDVEWRRVMTALLEVGYDYVLWFEHRGPGHVGGGRLRAVHPVPEAADHQEAAQFPVRPGGWRRARKTSASSRCGQAGGRRGDPDDGDRMLGYAFMGKAHSNASRKSVDDVAAAVHPAARRDLRAEGGCGPRGGGNATATRRELRPTDRKMLEDKDVQPLRQRNPERQATPSPRIEATSRPASTSSARSRSARTAERGPRPADPAKKSKCQ